MNRHIKFLVAIIFISIFSIGTVQAASPMLTGKHDLTALGTIQGGGGQDLCRFCHAPHNSNAVAPLWDRTGSLTAGSFILYDNPATMGNTMIQPAGVSLGCLSCHDGVTAADALTGITTPSLGNMNTNNTGSAAILGADLSNDHPIGVSVEHAATVGEFATAANIIAGGVRLFGAGTNQVECASCHNPHETVLPFFLRKDPTGGDLCDTCHTK
jgi:predicted CXXCH cytochrome family protein